MSKEEPVIRASEIAEYAFCARAWWLGQVTGYRSVNQAALRRGRAQHRDHGRAVVGYHLIRRLGLVLVALAAVALVAWLFLSMGW